MHFPDFLCSWFNREHFYYCKSSEKFHGSRRWQTNPLQGVRTVTKRWQHLKGETVKKTPTSAILKTQNVNHQWGLGGGAGGAGYQAFMPHLLILYKWSVRISLKESEQETNKVHHLISRRKTPIDSFLIRILWWRWASNLDSTRIWLIDQIKDDSWQSSPLDATGAYWVNSCTLLNKITSDSAKKGSEIQKNIVNGRTDNPPPPRVSALDRIVVDGLKRRRMYVLVALPCGGNFNHT